MKQTNLLPVPLSRNTKRRLVFHRTLVGLIAFAGVFCTAVPGRSLRGPLGALDAREQKSESK